MAFRHELATQLIGGFSSRKKAAASASGNVDACVLENMAGDELVRMPVKRPKRCSAHAKIPAKWALQEGNYLWLFSVQQSFLS